MKIIPTFGNLNSQNILSLYPAGLTLGEQTTGSHNKQSIFGLNALDPIIMDDTLQTKHIQIHTKRRINRQHLDGIPRLEPHCSTLGSTSESI